MEFKSSLVCNLTFSNSFFSDEDMTDGVAA